MSFALNHTKTSFGAEGSKLAVGDVVTLRDRPGNFLITGFMLAGISLSLNPVTIDPRTGQIFPLPAKSFNTARTNITGVRTSGTTFAPFRAPFFLNPMAIGGVSAVSAGASGYHGYKRNHGSLPWAIGWGLLGAAFPIVTPIVALVQGYGKPAK